VTDAPARALGPAPTSRTGWLRGACHRFFFTREPVYAAVYLRVFLGLWTLAFFLPRLPYLTELYGSRLLRHPPASLRWLTPPVLPPGALWALVLLLMAALIAFACGVHARRLHLLILVLLAYLLVLDLSILVGYGGLAFCQWLLGYFVPYDRLRDDRGEVREQVRFGTRLVMLQFCSVYLFTVLAKTVGGAGWWDGSALYYSWRGHSYGQFLLSAWFPVSRDVAKWLGRVILASEGFIALGMWHRRTRFWAMLVCLGMHLGMLLSLRVSPLFHLLMLGHLPLFVPAATWSRCGGPARRRALSEAFSHDAR
jgi:hypothetical protein